MSLHLQSQRQHPDQLIIGLVSVSDRASSGQYQDEGIPALRRWLDSALTVTPLYEERLIPDERPLITGTLIDLVEAGCDLILTTGERGPRGAT